RDRHHRCLDRRRRSAGRPSRWMHEKRQRQRLKSIPSISPNASSSIITATTLIFWGSNRWLLELGMTTLRAHKIIIAVEVLVVCAITYAVLVLTRAYLGREGLWALGL